MAIYELVATPPCCHKKCEKHNATHGTCRTKTENPSIDIYTAINNVYLSAEIKMVNFFCSFCSHNKKFMWKSKENLIRSQSRVGALYQEKPLNFDGLSDTICTFCTHACSNRVGLEQISLLVYPFFSICDQSTARPQNLVQHLDQHLVQALALASK